MPERLVNTRVRLFPPNPDLTEPAGQDPTSPQEEEGLASLAYLANINPTNTAVSVYVNTLNNAAYATTLNGASPQ